MVRSCLLFNFGVRARLAISICNRFSAAVATSREGRSSHEDRRQLSVAVRALRLRTLHPAENISSALKGGVNLCQRRFLNEVLGFLCTEFVRNFGGEGATPIQRSSNASLLGHVEGVKFIRH
jgi:hypothetical protein